MQGALTALTLGLFSMEQGFRFGAMLVLLLEEKILLCSS